LSALTKMFIVLQLLFSVVCASLLIIFISKTENYKLTVTEERAKSFGLAGSYANAERAKATAEANALTLQGQLNTLTAQLAEAQTKADAAAKKAEVDNLTLSGQANLANAQVTTLTSANKTYAAIVEANQAELKDLRPKVAELTKQYADIYRVKNELDNQLTAANKAISKLQFLLAQGGGGGAGAVAPIGGPEGQIQVLTATSATTGGKINGRVSDVALAQGRTLIEMPLGERDGVKVGTKMFVYRANGYVGDATVERVSADQSVAVVISTKPGEAVKVGDLVSTVGQ
jgi:multidrug efflux pump subunit AcrA (membrane-fusion protein)